MPPSGAAKQKPNDACACGSGAKFKRCCGGAAQPSGLSTPQTRPGVPAPLSLAERVQLAERIRTAFIEAKAAEDTGDLGRATRRCVTGLSLCANAWGDGAGAPSLMQQTLLYLDYLVELYSRQGRLADAVDCHERALRLLASPPTTPFWARALLTVSNTAWRDDRPLPPVDARCTVTSETAQGLRPSLLQELYSSMGLAYARFGSHEAQALTAFQASLDALLKETASPDRDITAAALHENMGNLHASMGNLAACVACYDAAAALLARESGGEGVAVRRDGLAKHLEMNRASLLLLMASQQHGMKLAHCTDADLEAFEGAWQHCEALLEAEMSLHLNADEDTPASVCCAALGRVSTAAQLTRWVRRACTVPLVASTAQAAAARACRSCKVPPAHDNKLQRCSGCGCVCYCSEACQREDWKRHKAECAAKAPEPTCAKCASPLLPPEIGEDPDTLLTRGQQVFLLRCLHLVHRRCGEVDMDFKQCPVCEHKEPW